MNGSLARRVALSVSAGLCVAAGVAIFALLSGSFDDTDLRLIGTSLGSRCSARRERRGSRCGESATRLLLTTALPPILRRTRRSPLPARITLASSPRGPTARLAAEVLAAADRLEPHAHSNELRHEVGRLRELARTALD